MSKAGQGGGWDETRLKHTELLTNGGNLKYIVQESAGVLSGCANAYPYRHSNMITPRLHQSQE